ncbi:MAG: exonuclease [Veillonellaceae bacterium]|nr:exonuclease [Veillonellaceae bacterium]
MEFIAFDFETATQEPHSACALAVAHFRGEEVVASMAEIFQPPGMLFDDENIRVHQIRHADVADKPDFSGVWAKFLPFFTAGLPLVAHNAPFDTDVLRATLTYYGLTHPAFRYGDTLPLARVVWPDLPSYALNNIGRFLGHTFRHHRADEDAVACGKIVLAAASAKQIADCEQLFAACKTPLQTFLSEAGFTQGSLF